MRNSNSGSIDSHYYHKPMTSMFDIIVTLAIFAVCWFAVQRTLQRFGLVRST